MGVKQLHTVAMIPNNPPPTPYPPLPLLWNSKCCHCCGIANEQGCIFYCKVSAFCILYCTCLCLTLKPLHPPSKTIKQSNQTKIFRTMMIGLRCLASADRRYLTTKSKWRGVGACSRPAALLLDLCEEAAAGLVTGPPPG